MDEALYEQAACGLLTTDASGTIIAVNQTLLRGHDVEIVLERSDLLFAYTDGISEARRGVKQFGEDNVLAVVERTSDLPVDAVADHMIAAVIDFAGTPNEDDVAAIAIRTSDNAT